jgi:hypothetical protein
VTAGLSNPEFDWLLRAVAGVSVPGETTIDPPLPDGSRLGAFTLQEVIGCGGMGVVYRAHDARLSRDVALKVLPRSVAPGEPGHQRLLDEARAAAALSHPNVASVYEAGEVDGRTYFAMELVRGSSLRARLDAGGLSAATRWSWAMAIARALASLHTRGWLHLDVKPENVMVGHGGEIKLLDFGLARAEENAQGGQGGTPRYMAPEQLHGAAPDARTDVFAFGVLLRELLPGDARARAIVARCMERDRERRFAAGEELVTALESPRRRWLKAVPFVLLVLGAIALWRTPAARSVPTYLPALRLTGNGVDRPISAAALSWDGKRLAYVDDDGLLLGPAEVSAVMTRVPFEELITYVEAIPQSSDWAVLSRTRDGRLSFWRLAQGGAPARLVHRSDSKFISPHPDGDTLVTVEATHLSVRRASGGDPLWTLPIPPNRHVCSARWSPDGKRLAVAYSENLENGRARAIEVWDAERRVLAHSIRSPRLAQGYVPVVFAWASDGSLLYAWSDAPGAGSGSAVLRERFDGRGPSPMASFEGQFLAAVGMAEGGQLLTLRNDIHARVQVADVTSSGELSAAQTLTTDEFDEKSVTFGASDVLWQMTYREFVPRLSMRNTSTKRAEPVTARGWAQTWPTAVGSGGALLYFAAEGKPFEEHPTWQLLLREGETTSVLRTPAPLVEPLAAVATPPITAQVRCASRVRACVVATLQGRELSLWSLSLDGAAPAFLFRLQADASFQAWQLSRDGTRVVLATAEPALDTYDLQGTRLATRPLPGVRYVRSLALAEEQNAVYAAVLADSVPEQRLLRVTPAAIRELLTHPAIAYGDLAMSPDERRLAFVTRSFDTDVWLAPVRP